MSNAASERPTKREFPSNEEARELVQKAREKYLPPAAMTEIAKEFPAYSPPEASPLPPGLPPAPCDVFRDNADWMPPAFVQNATAAWLATPDDPSGNAMRAALLGEIERAAPAFKDRCRRALVEWDHDPLGLADYEAWVSIHFAKVAYGWYTEAYRAGQCPCGPAPFVEWAMVCTIAIPFFKLVPEAIDLFGSCHCTPGRW